MCPMYLGVKRSSPSRSSATTTANLVNFGHSAAGFAKPADYDGIEPNEVERRDGASRRQGRAGPLRNERSAKTIECTCTLSEKQTAAILAGGS